MGSGEQLDSEAFDRFAARLSYVPGDFGDPSTYDRVEGAIAGARSPVFYLEIPPFLFGTVVKNLAEVGLTKTARVVVEKPFGHDLEGKVARTSSTSMRPAVVPRPCMWSHLPTDSRDWPRPRRRFARCAIWRYASSHSCRPSAAASPSNSPPSATAEADGGTTVWNALSATREAPRTRS